MMKIGKMRDDKKYIGRGIVNILVGIVVSFLLSAVSLYFATDKYGIEIGKPGNLILLNAESGYDAVRRRAEVLYSIREGRVIAKTIPSKSYINMNEEKEVTFKR